MSSADIKRYMDVMRESPEAEDALDEFVGIQEDLMELTQRLHDAIRAYLPEELRYWETYGLAQLKIIAGSDEYMSNDASITDLIRAAEAKLNGGE